MKIQCSCGAKYVIDVTPGMQPVQFLCQHCGQDYSAFINDLIRQELGSEPSFPVATLAPAPSAPASAPAAPPTPPPPPAEGSRLKISKTAHAPAAADAPPAGKVCLKHSEPASEQCMVCKKPICPKCMHLFGYFCSPFCKSKADSARINAPAYAGNMFVAESRYWEKVGRIFMAVGAVAVLFVSVWVWYEWFGSRPHPYFSVRFDDKSHSGGSYITNGQVVFLHGGTLARYDLKTKKPVWSLDLVTKEQVAAILKEEDEEEAKAREIYGRGEGGGAEPRSMREKHTRLALEEELSLHVSGQNIWIDKGDELTHYEWETGKVLQTVTLTNSFGEFSVRGEEFVMLDGDETGAPAVTRISMTTGERKTDAIPGLVARAPATAPPAVAQNATRPGKGASGGGGLPLTPYGDPSKPLDPQKVAAQAQNLTPGAKIALPALIAGNLHQQRIFQELNADAGKDPQKPGRTPASAAPPAEDFSLVRDGDSFLQFASRMTEAHIVERSAMKAPPKKSTLDGNLNVTQTADVANEMLNEMQRNNGGDTVTEDNSRYQATVRQPGTPDAAWSGEVIGRPELYPMKSVNVVAGGKTVVVLDKANKKLWQASTTFDISGGGASFLEEKSRYGAGPCVERDGALYVFDEGMLTAFDLMTGNVRWRLPSVGIVGLFFDDQGMLYLNTTTGSLDDIKFSRQIDVTKSTQVVFMKIDPRGGKTLWTMKPHGLVCYLSGKFIYTSYTFDPGDEEDQLSDATAGLLNPPILWITRIDPKTGKEMWNYVENRAAMDVTFDKNSIQLIFKKEVELLHYVTL